MTEYFRIDMKEPEPYSKSSSIWFKIHWIKDGVCIRTIASNNFRKEFGLALVAMEQKYPNSILLNHARLNCYSGTGNREFAIEWTDNFNNTICILNLFDTANVANEAIQRTKQAIKEKGFKGFIRDLIGRDPPHETTPRTMENTPIYGTVQHPFNLHRNYNLSWDDKWNSGVKKFIEVVK